MRVRWLVIGLPLLVCGGARAEEESEREPQSELEPEPLGARQAERELPPPTTTDRAVAAGLAAVPGAVAHGAGHFALGEPDTGTLLLIAEGTGIAMVLGGGAVLVLSGASRYLVGPAAAVTALGVGVFAISFAADLYGVLSPDPGAAALRERHVPWVETELGYRRVGDPRFDHSDFVVQRVALRSGRLRFEPSLSSSLSGDNARYRLEGGYRLLGAAPEDAAAAAEGEHLDVVLGVVRHAYPTDWFMRSSVELALEGRYDLARVGPTLSGSFVELGAGYALGRIDYDIPRTPVPGDTDDLLLVRFGFGVRLRGQAGPGSEFVGYYDHRHDDLAAGFLMPGLGSGVIGHFGAELRYFFDETWGIQAMSEIGSAFVGGVSLLFRQNGRAPW